MSGRQKIARTLYQQLLKLYPRAFREQFGASMVQTFDDLCREQQRQRTQGWYGLVCGMFVETASGIFREHLLLRNED